MNVRADVANNRLYIKLSGVITKREWEKIYTEIRFIVPDLRPGYHVIADYSESNLVRLDGITAYRKLINYLIKNGVGEVVRIIDNKSLLYQQVKNLSSRICSYKPLYALNQEEAEQKIATSKRRNGLRFHYNDLPVAIYRFDDAEGKGQILNLSTSGCAIGSASILPATGADISILIDFRGPKDTKIQFIIKARVVRVDDYGFALEFHHLSDDQKKKLLECLLSETEREILTSCRPSEKDDSDAEST